MNGVPKVSSGNSLHNAEEEFRNFIKSVCGSAPDTIIADGKWHRFRMSDTRHKSSQPGRYLLHLDAKPVGLVMDWRDEKKRHRWFGQPTGETLDREEIISRRNAREMDRLRGFQDAADEAKAFWAECKPINELHPYLERKGVAPYRTRQGSGKRFGLGDTPCVIVPIISAEGAALTLQAIRADGERRFWPGSTHEGGHHMIGEDDGKSPIVFCEGFSTAATLHAATGFPVVMTINSSNMIHVARWASHRWPDRDKIVAGDDDWHLVDHPKVKRNVGKESAEAMARAMGGRVIMPDMMGLCSDGGDDFNDMAKEYGLEDVAALFNEPAPPTEPAQIEDALGFSLTDWSTDKYAGEAPPIRWLCEGSIPQGVPALFAAMGGVGKSFMAIDLAMDIASEVIAGNGTRRILGGCIREHGSVVILGAEDAKDSVHRRMASIDPDGSRRASSQGRLFAIPLPEVGGPMTLINGQSGEFMQTKKLEALIEQLKAIPDLKLVILDPLQAFITANITADPAAGQFMWSSFSRICAETGATIIACHHMRKEGATTISNADAAREAIRGSTALIDGARATYALWAASEDDARRVCMEADVEYRPKRVVNGAVVKSNDEHDWEVHTYLRGDSGLLADAHEAGKNVAKKGGMMTDAQCLDMLKTIDERWSAGRPFSASSNARDRFIVNHMVRAYGVSKHLAQRQVDDWFHVQMVGSDMVDKKTKMTGLRVLKWPD